MSPVVESVQSPTKQGRNILRLTVNDFTGAHFGGAGDFAFVRNGMAIHYRQPKR